MRRVFVLGAGFSKAVANLPLTAELLDEMLRDDLADRAIARMRKNGSTLDEKIYDKFRKRIIKTQKEVRCFFERIRGRFNVDPRLIPIEALFTYLDMNYEKITVQKDSEENSTEGYPLWNWGKDPKLVRSDLTYLLFNCFRLPDPSEEQRQLLSDFIEKALPIGSAIITFNYDTILERYLMETNKWDPNNGYGISFANSPANVVRKDSFDIKILKLHGSLNWQYTAANEDIELVWNNELAYVGRVDGGPLGGTQWVIPSWIKTFLNPKLAQVWRIASISLSKADEIYVIGYSLPLPDSAVHALLSCCDFSNCKRFVIISKGDAGKI